MYVSNRRECGISSCWSGLLWTNKVSEIAKREGKAFII